MSERTLRRTSLGGLLALFTLLAIGVAASGWTYYRKESARIQAARYEELRGIAALKIMQIVNWRQQRLEDAGLAASRNGLRDPVLAWLDHPAQDALRRDVRGHMSLFRNIRDYQNVILASPEGGLLLSLDPRTRGEETEITELARSAIQNGKPLLGDLFRCRECGQIHLDAAAPLLDDQGQARAVILLRTDPERGLYPLLQSWPAFGQTGETLLVRREGSGILFLNRLRHAEDPPLTLRRPMDTPDLPAAQAVLGRTGRFLGRDYRNEAVISDLNAIPDSPWFMVAKVDEREILAELHYRNRVVLAVTALGIAMLGVLLGFLFYLGQAKLYRDLFQASHLDEDRMSTQDARWVGWCIRIAGASGTVTFLIGALSLLGWILDAPALKGILPGFVAMKTNTALGLMLAGMVIVLRAWFPRCWRIPIALATVLATLGAVTFAQYLFHLDLHIDQWLFTEPASALGTLAPNRMAPATAVAFLLSGLALVVSPFRRGAALSQWLALPVGLIGMLPLLGYLYGPIGASGLGHYLQLALHTALALILVCLGLLMLNPTEGFARVLTARSMGGWLLRRLLPIILVISVLIGWLRAVGEQWGWFEHAMAIALLVTAFILFFVSSVWWVARSLDHMDTVRSQAEARAHEAAEEIRATLYGIGDGVIAANHEGAVVHMNPVAEQLTGWKEPEAIGRSLNEVFRIVNEDTRETVESPVERVLRDGRIVGLANHTILIARDGTERAIADSGAPVRNAMQDIARVVLVFRDQTEERSLARLIKVRMDLQIFAAQHPLDELLTHTLDEAGRLVGSPIGFYHFYEEETGNLTLQQWSTRTLKEFCKAGGEGAHYALDQAGVWVDCIRQRKPVIHNDYLSLPHRRGLPDGHAPVVRELVVPVLQGNRVVAILGVGNKPTDYTDRDVETIRFLADETWSIIEHKRYETALQASEAKYRQLHENLRDAYARVDRDGYIVDHNHVFEEMVGYSTDELRHMTYRDLTPPEWQAEEDRILREQVEVRGFSKLYEKAYQRKDGTIFPVELRTIAFYDDQGRPAGMWALVRDISERKRVEGELRRTHAELQLIFKNMINAFVIWDSVFDEHGTYVSFRFGPFNDAYARISGLDLETVRGKDVFEVWPDTERSWLEAYGAVATTGAPHTFDMYHAPTQGWYHCNAYRPTESPSHICVIFEDITERKLHEDRQREAERMVRGTLDALSKHIAILDEQGVILDVNQAWRRFAEENPPIRGPVNEGANYFEVCAATSGADAPSAAAFAEGIRDVMAGKRKEYTQEYDCHSPGTQRWFLGRVTRFAGEGPLRVVVAHENITERKRAVEALRSSEEKFRLLVESNPDAIFVQTAGRFVYVNEAALRLFMATSPADLLNQPVLDRIPSDRRSWLLERISEVNVERKQHPRHEEQFLRLDGIVFSGEVSAVPIHFEGQDGALVFLHDITSRKAAETQIRTQTELLNLTGEMAKVGGWEFDTRTFQSSWTDEVARIYDLDPANRIDAGEGLSFYNETSRPILAKALQEAVEQGRSYDLELELISAKGVRKNIRTIGHPLRNTEGHISQVRGILMDITEKKAAEDEIRRAQAETQRLLEIADRSRGALLSLVEDLRMSEEEVRSLNIDLEQRVESRTQELAEANRELEAFAYSVSHDLRAPLRHMDGFLSMLERHLSGTIDEKGARYLQVAQRAAVRMAQLVDGLLSFSRLGRTELRCMTVETSHLVASVVDEFAPECSDRVVRWDIGPLPAVHGDPTLLRLVFQNLLGNALKFTRNRPEALIEIRTLDRDEGEVTLSIRDNGAGFDPAYTHKLFGVFQRLHREDEFEGTGIGLANVHRIVTRHGGRVWAEGRLDDGATFFITLPTLGRD